MTRTYRKPHSYKRKKSILKNRFFWLTILFLLILGGFFYFLFLADFFQVKNINISGEQKVSADSLKLTITDKLEQKIILFKTKSIFLINPNEMKKDILNKFPQIAEIEIKRGFPDSLNAIVIERESAANWCQNDKCFLVDNEGIIFALSAEALAEAERIPSETKLIKIIDKIATSTLILGEKVIEKDDLGKILKIAPKLESDLKIPIQEFSVYSEGTLTAATQEGWEIYFNLQSDIDWQMTKLGAVLEEKIPPDKRKDLEYIELRFGNFAPFKYRD